MSKLEQLKKKLSGVKRLAWKPIVQEGDGDLTVSKFGGKPWLNADEEWPCCPNCGKPIQLFLQLNLDELPQNLNTKFGNGILQFFYCTNEIIVEHDTGLYGRTVEECETLMMNLPHDMPIKGRIGVHVDWQGDIGKVKILACEQDCVSDCEGWSPFSRCQLVRIFKPKIPSAFFEIPEIGNLFEPKLIVGWKEVDDYPNWLEIDDFETTLDEDEKDFLDEILMEELHQGSDKLAGWADWVQHPEYPDCPICKHPMNEFVFQFESDDNIPYMWGDGGVGYIVQCPEHKETVAFFWQCA
ncbi:MAG: DUF1963 domain-containing protein [Nostoc sp.]|uniref:DUF1963 domain-containing protein n=1 Tax=Nostoc sp. TaxID=1180 RepID=UPI002FF8348B